MNRYIATLLLFCAFPSLNLRALDLNQLIPGLYSRNGNGFDGTPGIRVGSTNGHEAHFSFGSAVALRGLNEQLGKDFAVFPFNSAVGAFNFTFDPELGNFVSATDTLGPLFAERGQTLGEKNLNLGFAFTFFHYDTFNGQSLDNYHVGAKHLPGSFPGGNPNEIDPGTYEEDTLDIRLKVDAAVKIYSFTANYGVTERLEVGLLVPMVDVDLNVHSRWSSIVSPNNPTPGIHTTDPAQGAEPQNDRVHGSAFGPGDLLLRSKYQFLREKPVDLAIAVIGKLATGDEANFLGSGDTRVRPLIAASRRFSDVFGKPLSVTPHVNIGYELNVDDSRRNSVEYAVGVEGGAQRVTVALDFLGSRRDDDGQHRAAVSLGAKWNVWKRLILSANLITPLNDEGLRSDLITTLGAEYSFKF
ncbi:MAG: hypothetical protein ABIQ35_04400 [Verrucomicrobiota bacterium]